MWNLLGRPDQIDMYQIVELLPLGYQKNSILLKLGIARDSSTAALQPLKLKNSPSLEVKKFRVCFPFPSAANKKDGSLQVLPSPDEKLKTLVPNYLCPDQYKVYDNARKLKSEPVDLVNVQEMYAHYNYNDFGYLTFELLEDVWYGITYTHKISSESIIFIPFRLSGTMNLKKPEYNYSLWVKGGKRYNLQKFLTVSSSKEFPGFDKFSVNKEDEQISSQGFGYEQDIKIHTTDAWDSSDDEPLDGSDSEELD